MTGLALQNVSVEFGTGRNRFRALDDVNLAVPPGKVLGLVGESGSGKSTVARVAVGLVPQTSGRVLIGGDDVATLPRDERKRRQRRVQMIFQDPFASLDPRMSIGETVGEAITAAGGRVTNTERVRRTRDALDLVGLADRYVRLLPRELSGGQRQRVAIARALAAEPEVLVADEITSALDASVQGAILNLLRDLHAELNLSILFISHDLSLVRYVSDEIAVMYLGRIVETAPAADLIETSEHPYTSALLDAVPTLDGRLLPAGDTVDGDPPDPRTPPQGCHFHPRCPVGPLADPTRTICASEDPHLDAARRRHNSACHFAQITR